MRLGVSQRKPALESSSVKSKTNRGQRGNGGALRQSVSSAVQTYLDQLDGELGSDVYQMVLAQVEAPLLEEIMRYTRNNQTKASQMLGINRGTLRKKLRLYGLLTENSA